MSVTSNPTPGDELIPDTSGLPDLSGVDTPASSPEGIPERDVMAPGPADDAFTMNRRQGMASR